MRGPDSFRRWVAAGGIFLGCSILYFLTRSPALDEWDSVQFAFGVGDFNIWRHQPHPPGYPVYIAWGWVCSHVLPLGVPDALALGSALGGGLFVACWFVLIARRFALPIASAAAATLATLLITWMTATKVLTDGSEAGLLAVMLLLLDSAMEAPGGPGWHLAGGALVGAVAAGVRPQNTGIILLVLCLAIRRVRVPARNLTAVMGVFFACCLLWLLPTMWLQAHTPEAAGDWWAYPRQLLAQWRWRLDQPKAFLGARGQTEGLLVYRLEHHPLGWLTRGFGFALDSPWGWLGIGFVVLGWVFYGLRLRKPRVADLPSRERAFWSQHLPWGLAYAAMIFCFLPGDQRYYLPIFPLLVLPIIAGWWWCLGRRRELVWVIPVVTFGVTLPYAVENHLEPAPPVLLMRWLQAAIPFAQRRQVWLILRDTRRHAEWYAPEFHIVRAENFTGLPANALSRAVYTDDPSIAARPIPGGRWLLLKTFSRSPLIYRKHSEDDLYVFHPQSLVE